MDKNGKCAFENWTFSRGYICVRLSCRDEMQRRDTDPYSEEIGGWARN